MYLCLDSPFQGQLSECKCLEIGTQEAAALLKRFGFLAIIAILCFIISYSVWRIWFRCMEETKDGYSLKKALILS